VWQFGMRARYSLLPFTKIPPQKNQKLMCMCGSARRSPYAGHVRGRRLPAISWKMCRWPLPGYHGEYMSMLKCLCTEGRNFLDCLWSEFSGKEQWPLHDFDLGKVAVYSSIPGILGNTIKQMTARIQFTHKPSSILVITTSYIFYLCATFFS
jgi:hypothetical protein